MINLFTVSEDGQLASVPDDLYLNVKRPPTHPSGVVLDNVIVFPSFVIAFHPESVKCEE